MKRISFLVVTAVALTAGVGDARVYVSYDACRFMYSPYAWEPGNSGLISDYVQYSPYAFGPGQSGLVLDTMQYSPYMYALNGAGLVSNYGACGVPYLGWNIVGHSPSIDGRLSDAIDHLADSIQSMAGHRGVPAMAPTSGSYRQASPYTSKRVVRWGFPAWIDQKQVIQNYLKDCYPGQFQVTRVLKIDNDTVCFDVVFADRNLVVKYWSPGKINWVKRQGQTREKVYSSYLISWLPCRDEYLAQGYQIQHIASNDSDEVIEKLMGYLESKESNRG